MRERERERERESVERERERERESVRERERERERERHGLRLRRIILRSCRDLYSFPCFNSKFPELIVNNTPVFFPSM